MSMPIETRRTHPGYAALVALGLACATAPNAFCTTILYALTAGTAGVGPIYRSSDSGTTWQATTMPGLALAVDPQNPNIVYSLFRTTVKKSSGDTGPALLRSTDGGQTYTSSPFSGSAPLAVDSSAPNILYARAATGGLYRSTDSGATWTRSLADSPQAIRTDPAAPGVVLALTAASAGGFNLEKSTDYGASWTVIATSAEFGGSVWDVAFDGKNPNLIYLAGSKLCSTTCTMPYSTDGGKTWQTIGLAGNFGNVVIDPGSGTVYAAGQSKPQSGSGVGIVALSSDRGKTWSTFNTGLSHAAQVHLDPESPSILYANQWSAHVDINNAASGVLVSRDGGQTWTLRAVDTPANGVGPNAYYVYSLVAVSDKNAVRPNPPAIDSDGVVNGASFQPGVVPDSWMTITGTSLASRTDDWSNSVVNGNLPTTLDGIKVSVGGKPAYICYVSPTQLNVLAPDVLPGPVTVTVTNADGASASVTATASQYGPAFFTWPGNQPVATRPDYSYAVKAGTFTGVTTVAAKPGNVIVLWGTGFGPTVPPAPTGVVVPVGAEYATVTLPTVTIDNIAATVYGAALTPGAAGLYQVAIQVPSSLPDGEWPIVATINGSPSPAGVVLSVHH